MANEEHLKILKQGVDVWNRWRKKNNIQPQLVGAKFIREVLNHVDFSGSDLTLSNFQGAKLIKAKFNGAILKNASPFKYTSRKLFL